MEICEENHNPIVHNEKYCPLCEAIDEVIGAQDEIENLREEVDKL